MSPTTLRPDVHGASAARFFQFDTAPEDRVDEGFQRALRTVFPVRSADGSASLEFVSYQTESPRYSADECRRRGYLYSCPIKVVVRLVIWDDVGSSQRSIRDIKEQEIYFGVIPLIDESGALVVDGVERVPLLRFTAAPGARHATAPDRSPAVMVTPKRGQPLTLWINRRGELRASLDEEEFSGDRLLRAFGVDPTSMQPWHGNDDIDALGRLLGPADHDAPGVWFADAFVSGQRFDLSPLGRRSLNAALGLDVDASSASLTARDLVALVEVLRADRLLDENAAMHHIRTAGDHFEDAAWEGIYQTLLKARQRMVKAIARDSIETFMPHDLLDARPMTRAWLNLLQKSPLVVNRDVRTPLSRAAQSWRVLLDDKHGAVEHDPWSRWITCNVRDKVFGDLSPDAPLDEHGVIAPDARGDGRSLVARFCPPEGDDARPAILLRAMTLESPEAPAHRPAIGRDIAVRGGALIVAERAGVVRVVSDRRVWVSEDGRDEPRSYTLVPRGAPRIETPFTLRPVVRVGQRVAAGDAIAASGCVVDETLALGRRCAVRTSSELSPWNCRVSSAMRAAFRAVRVESIEAVVRDTRMGVEQLEPAAPGVDAQALRHVDASGLAALGAVLEAGDVLASIVTPIGWENVKPGELRAAFEARPVRATARCTVSGVEVFARRGRERSPRHDSVIAAMRADIDDEIRELTSAVDGDEDRAARRQMWLEEEGANMDRGTDLPPGVVSCARFDLLVSQELAATDALATLGGRSWSVIGVIDDDAHAYVELPEGAANRDVYLVRLAPAAVDQPVKKRPTKSAKKTASGAKERSSR